MILNRAPRTILMLNRVILNTSRSLVYNRPIASASLVKVWRNRPAVRLLSTNNTSSDTSSPLGKASSEMHGGGDKESRTINEKSSPEAEDEQTSDEPLETVILKTAMNFVPELGFTDEAISRG